MEPQRPPLTKLKFIEPMYARLVKELPEGEEWLYEVKFDGTAVLRGMRGSNRPIGSLQDRFLRYRDRPRKR